MGMQKEEMFGNFEEFQDFINRESKNIKNWSFEKLQEFSQNVSDLLENDEDFKSKYATWTKQLENQAKEQKGKTSPITLDAKSSAEEIRNQIRLQQLKKHKAAENIKILNTSPKSKAIVIGGTEKDNQENKTKLENIKKSQKVVNMGIIIKKKKYRI